MEKYSFAFVILHYIAQKDTEEAVDSILAKAGNTYPYHIVVVDNGSPDGSGAALEARYQENSLVDVVLSPENLGFAGGNNLGIRRARELFDPTFVVAVNNDILLRQEDFPERIVREYEHSHFAVLGPMIETADGKKSSSPVLGAPVTGDAIRKNLRKEKRMYFFERLHLQAANRLLNKIARQRAAGTGRQEAWKHRAEDVVLHGCCLIFSPEYFRVYEGFEPSTFLYHEEEMLYIRNHFRGLKMVYEPELQIYHKEDVSSDQMLPDKREKRLFKLKHCIASSGQLLRVWNELTAEETEPPKNA